ncbi:hypothetical protein HNR46_001608 [Haloferula luteola]|uniref:Uncharacterized protein n=2 Tax=Haloferula luteola TaxID=595692 RepID=A0A840V030_9BACT|nr:hypothetical protein [Haloferula luteola]
MSGDCEKLNEAQRLGWKVLQFTALHFQEKDRATHKLTSPLETIRAAADFAPTESARLSSSGTQGTLF